MSRNISSIEKLAEMRAKKSKKSHEELRQDYADTSVGPYEEVRLDDEYAVEKMKAKSKLKPFYERLKTKQG
jgi:hypothetical protein